MYYSRGWNSIFSGFFSQKMYVFWSPKSFGPSTNFRSKEKSNRASVNRMIDHASFCPRHLCRPNKKGSKASRRSFGKGESGRKRSGTNVSGSVKFEAERKVGYWFTETKVCYMLIHIKRRFVFEKYLHEAVRVCLRSERLLLKSPSVCQLQLAGPF